MNLINNWQKMYKSLAVILPTVAVLIGVLLNALVAKGYIGSELCRAMINRGDKIVLCIVRDYEHENDIYYDAITHCSNDYLESTLSSWRYAIPINNQGEPLTASEVGL